jgi:CspA family cold shock protein
MARAVSKHTTKPTAFLNAVARVHLSHLFQDPFLRAAFKAAEDDGLAPRRHPDRQDIKDAKPPGPRSAAFCLPCAPIAVLLSPCTSGDNVMASGIVKWFNAQKGYGFIQPDGGGKDVFVHISAVEKAGMDGLPEGAKISYDMISDRGKESAGNLQLK